MSLSIHALPRPYSEVGWIRTHRHWPHHISGQEAIDLRRSNPDFKHMVACIAEGFCPWCEGQLKRWEPRSFEVESVLGSDGLIIEQYTRELTEPEKLAQKDWAKFGWCECCLYGFRIVDTPTDEQDPDGVVYSLQEIL